MNYQGDVMDTYTMDADPTAYLCTPDGTASETVLL